MSTLAALPERYALMACATRAGSARDAGQDDRYRLVVGYVGEDGIEPNTPYRVVDGELVAADEAVTA